MQLSLKARGTKGNSLLYVIGSKYVLEKVAPMVLILTCVLGSAKPSLGFKPNSFKTWIEAQPAFVPTQMQRQAPFMCNDVFLKFRSLEMYK